MRNYWSSYIQGKLDEDKRLPRKPWFKPRKDAAVVGGGPPMSESKKPTVSEIRAHHTPTVIPPCRVCGEELSLQACGGGEPTRWGCSGTEDDPERPGLSRYKVGRNCADEHYSQSVFVDRKHDDPGVLYLLDLVERMRKALSNQQCPTCENPLGPSHKKYREPCLRCKGARALLEEIKK